MPTNYDRAAIEVEGTYTVPVTYSTLTLFDNIPQKDQIEVFRKDIETVWEAANSQTPLTLTRNEKNTFGIVKPEWITYDTVNKTITGIEIPENSLFTRDDGTTLVYPPMSAGEALRIKRKTINYDTLVEWVNGSRITADQLNLLASQLLGISQENLHELEKNVIKTEDAGIEYATPTYVDEQIDLLQNQVQAGGTISNGINHDKRLIYLARDTGTNTNITTVLENIKWFNADNSLKMYFTGTTQVNNILEFRTSGDSLVNYFNGRGVLNQAGRIYYGNSTPATPNAADTGLLWWDNGANLLRVWNGSTWLAMPTNTNSVSLDGTQTITGQKIFTNAANYFGTATANTGRETFTKSLILRPEVTTSVFCYLKGYVYPDDATNKDQTIVIAPWNGTAATPVYKGVLNLSPTAVQVQEGISFGCHQLGSSAKAVIATIADTQTITGQKTFSNAWTNFTGTGIILNRTTPDAPGGTFFGRIIGANTTDWNNNQSGLIMANNFAPSAQIILMQPDSLNKDNPARTGIQIRARNPSGNGELVVDGNLKLFGDLILSDNSNRRIRNLANVRVPGQQGTIYSTYNSTVNFHDGLYTFPECTITYSVTETTISVTVTRFNSIYSQGFRFLGYTGASRIQPTSYQVSYSSTQGTNNTYVPNLSSPITGSLAVSLPGNTTNNVTVTVTKAASPVDIAYLTITVLE